MALFHYFVHGKSCSELCFILSCIVSELVFVFNQWVVTIGCYLVCVKIPTLPRRRSEKVHNHKENYSTRCHIDNRLLQNMMRYHVDFKGF